MSLFAGDPQPVEIHHRGIWYSGELLGWTTAEGGHVLARVRCVVDGLRHSTWKDLAELRLPDPARPPRCETFPAPPARPTFLADEDDEDATRPHALLAGLRSRPRRPEHAVTPPPAPAPPRVPAPVLPPAPAARPTVRASLRAHLNRRRSDELSAV